MSDMNEENADQAEEGLSDRAKRMLDKVKGDAADAAGGGISGKAMGAAGAAAGGLAGKAGDLLGGAKDAATEAVGKAGDMASGAADKAGDMVGGAKDAAAGMADKAGDMVGGATDKVTGAAGAATGGVADAASGAADRAGDMVGDAKDTAAGMADKATGAAAATTGGVAAAATGAAASTSNTTVSTSATTSSTTASTSSSSASVSASDPSAVATSSSAQATAPIASASQGGSSGGAGSSGGGDGGWFDDDDDDEKLFADVPIGGRLQVVLLGLIAAGLFLFGGTLLGFFGGDDAELLESAGIAAATDGICGELSDELADANFTDEELSDVTCEVDGNGQVTLTGEVESEELRGAIGIAAGAAVLGSGLLDNDLNVAEPLTLEAAAPTTTTEAPTTTAAPATTTEAAATTAAETTTTEPPAPAAFTMWDALTENGEAGQFQAIGGALGLRDDLDALETETGEPVNRTLFAPSDAAIAALNPAELGALVADPDAAAALVGYHFIDSRFTAAELAAAAGNPVPSRVGLPINIGVDGDTITINGTTMVITADLEADNGIVHIIDVLLTPPTINQVIDLQNIEFEVNSANITAAGQEELGKAVAFFTENETARALIEGHTDTDGDEAANLDLSNRRAESVKAFLVANGIEDARLTTQGFGELQPILVDGVEDKDASRRIEFRLR